MTKIQTIEEHLAEIITGKVEGMICTGFPIPGLHEPTEYRLIIGIASYSYTCPICGFGSGGLLREETCNALLDLQRLRKTTKGVEE